MMIICNSPNPKRKQQQLQCLRQVDFAVQVYLCDAAALGPDVSGWKVGGLRLAASPFPPKSSNLRCWRSFWYPIPVMFRFMLGKHGILRCCIFFGGVLTWYWHLSFFPFQSCLSMFRLLGLIFLHSNLCKLPWTLTLIRWPLFWATSDWASVHRKYVW